MQSCSNNTGGSRGVRDEGQGRVIYIDTGSRKLGKRRRETTVVRSSTGELLPALLPDEVHHQ